ncbi:MAG: TetR family transcriptional regulator, partial [Candidatus Dormiibacterota bacterium]
RGRLERAALALFGERGFENTTVAEIAARAGLTERTFFRYFADKREVLFGGAGALRELLVRTVDAAPATAEPLDVIVAAFEAAATMLQERRAFSLQRHVVIAANAELGEREVIKLSLISAALADALRRRGVAGSAASLTADTGIAIFRAAFQTWVDVAEQRELPQLIRDTFEELRAVAAGAEMRGARV